jgi:lipoprotein-anchoring transpeptidase ErfK/SrfK
MTKFRNFTAGAALLALAAVASPDQAQAQLFWDWSGAQTVGGTGKHSVRFPGNHRPGDIIVSFGDRKLYHVVAPGQATAYPVAVPREQSRWQGITSVTQKRENPSWTPTPSMRAENPRLPSWVPGGHPLNPLGVRALYLGSSMYRIHGTDAPWTIGTAASKGCIRMYNQDVIDLYSRVRVGAKVTVTWNRFGAGAVDTSNDPTPVSRARQSPQDRAAAARRYYRQQQQSQRQPSQRRAETPARDPIAAIATGSIE